MNGGLAAGVPDRAARGDQPATDSPPSSAPAASPSFKPDPKVKK